MIHLLAAASLLALSGVEGLPAQSGPDEEYGALVADAEAKGKQRDEELQAAHRALDEGAYERAVELAKHARSLEEEIGRIRGKARVSLRKLIGELVAKLDADEFAVREKASGRLRALGPAAVPGLIRHRRTETSPESRYRLDELLRGISVDDAGRIRQWAVEAAASSEYGSTDWSAAQMLGAPDSPQGVDAKTAWAAKQADGGSEWVRLKFPVAVRISKVRVHENLIRGGVVSIDVVGRDGVRRRAWEGADPAPDAPAVFEADLGGALGREIVIELDTKKRAGWEEIDAVELVGELVEE